MNWGKGIIITMGAFIVFILFMVFTLMSKKTDLVSEDYYKKEIDFEQEMEALKNASMIKEKVTITSNDAYIVIQFPSNENVSNIYIEMFRPDNKNDDQIIKEDNSKTVMISKKTLKKGTYNLTINYNINGKQLLQKEEIMIK